MRNFTVSGHLGADPKTGSKDEIVWTHLRVATNDGGKTAWFWVTAFGKLAANIAKKLKKGDGLTVHGEMKTNDHGGKERIELIAGSADFFPKNRG